MDALDEPFPARSWLAWLGLTKPAQRSPAPAATDPELGAVDPQSAVRQRQLGDIGDFLAAHRLPLTQTTLAAACDCINGTDPRLAALIAERRRAGEAITSEWLAECRRAAASEDEGRAMTRLMDRLEANIDTFTRTTIEARTATTEYRTALRTQVDELQHVSRAGAVLSEMLAIARTMMEHTREIEAQMARSEKETRTLHRNLDEARRTAEIDHLTGLPNRRAFEARLDKEAVAARAAGEPLCVAFCDIDRFKKINDTHGHEAGDRILKVVAHALNEISDERCHVARHGGEEFVVLFRGKSLGEAFAILDEARAALSERRLVNRATDLPFGKVTFSAGIADLFEYPDPRSALKAADEALYVAKHEGRNRIVRAPARLALVADNAESHRAA